MGDVDLGPGEFADVTLLDFPAYLKHEVENGRDPEYVTIPCIRRPVNQGPSLTPEQEEQMIIQQVEESKGFDIEFEKFRCIFNYKPVNFDMDDEQIITKPDTTKTLMDRLSRHSLAHYNNTEGTEYEFFKVLKANYHLDVATGTMFYITFQGKDPSDVEPKHFQATVCNYCFRPDKYISCDLKPETKRVHSIENWEMEYAKKPRLIDELANL